MSAADNLRRLTAEATPAPWERVLDGGGLPLKVMGPDARRVAYANSANDAALIRWLRNHADAIADLIDAASLACEDMPQCADPGVTPVAVCRSVFPENPEEWCGICTLRDALVALEADR